MKTMIMGVVVYVLTGIATLGCALETTPKNSSAGNRNQFSLMIDDKGSSGHDIQLQSEDLVCIRDANKYFRLEYRDIENRANGLEFFAAVVGPIEDGFTLSEHDENQSQFLIAGVQPGDNHWFQYENDSPYLRSSRHFIATKLDLEHVSPFIIKGTLWIEGLERLKGDQLQVIGLRASFTCESFQ